MRELNLKRVTFTFEDDSEKVLEGDELNEWITICYMHSDYLLPGNQSHVLGRLFGGIVRGFVPLEVAKHTEA
jgi:hypothetical protein